MPPFSPSIMAHVQPQFDIEMRALGKNTTGTALNLNSGEKTILQYLALTFSIISVASSVLAFYWFVRMRRSFRHDLIMLLIQSDMFKALWFMIYPIVVFSQGPISSDSRFCQVNGFFLSVGIEASDFAVLQIAIHTALYIWKPRVTRGEGGLFPYRYYAYFAWIALPLLMASLAFVNDQDSYVVEGTYCYLPVRPFWYRLALGWIPRYIIFIVILFIYVSIYFYVRYKFSGFTKTGRSPPSPNQDSMDSAEAAETQRTQRTPKRHDLPPTPTLACHGLIPESASISKSGTDVHRSLSTADPYGKEGATLGTHRFMWASFISKNSPLQVPTPPPQALTSDGDSLNGLAPEPLPLPRYSTMSVASRDATSMNPSPATTKAPSTISWRDNFVRRFSPTLSGRGSIIDMATALRRGPEGNSEVPTPVHRLELVNSRGQNLAHVEMHRTREKIRRQLRFLFIYPLVYMGMWIVPFISHVLQYDDRFAIDPPFGLTCVTTIFVCSQAAVDCWLFSTREKPWKHIPGSDGTFWGSLKFWAICENVGERRAKGGPGRTREEMHRDSRVAYQRRDEEMAERRKIEPGNLSKPEACFQRRESHWWDVPGFDGAHVDLGGMSPVAEEPTDPMDDYQDDSFSDDEMKVGAEKSQSSNGTRGPPRRNVSFQDMPVLSKAHMG